MNLGQGIKSVRERCGLSQEQFAERIDITNQYVSMMETNRKTPSWRMLCRMAGGLGIEVAQLVGEAESLPG